MLLSRCPEVPTSPRRVRRSHYLRRRTTTMANSTRHLMVMMMSILLIFVVVAVTTTEAKEVDEEGEKTCSNLPEGSDPDECQLKNNNETCNPKGDDLSKNGRRNEGGAEECFAFDPEASVLDYLRPSLFEDPETMNEISRNLKDGKLVVIKDAFDRNLAECMWKELSRDDLEWDLLEGVFDDGFHYKHHNIVEKNPNFTDMMWKVKGMFFQSRSKEFISDITGRDCNAKIDGSASASNYMIGDHSLPHSDYLRNRTVAFVWHLSKEWEPKYGGGLYWSNAHNHNPFVHASFNTLNLFSVTPNSTHFVTMVNEMKPPHLKRLTFNGWYDTDWVPQIEEPIEDMSEKDRLGLAFTQIAAIETMDFELEDDPNRKEKLWELRQAVKAQLQKLEDPDITFIESSEEEKEPVAPTEKSFVFKEDASIVDYLRPSLIEDPATIDTISRSLKDGKLVVIRDAFQQDLAEYMWQELSRDDLEWEVLQDGFDDGFHYRHHNIYEGHNNFSDDMKQLKAMFNNRKSKLFMSELAGRDCESESDNAGSASHYMVGDHSLPHSDYQGEQTVAYVWHLTKDWDPTWGGAFYWCPAHNRNPFIHPSFNTLILHTLSANSSHFVTAVNSLKPPNSKRLAFNGWYESDWMPNLQEEPIEDMPEQRRLSLTVGQLLAIRDADLESVTDDPERKQKLSNFQDVLTVQLGKAEDPDVHFA